MTIGIVLASSPQYSETFILSKIKGLQDNGFDVVVFSGNRSREKFTFKHVGSKPVVKEAFLQSTIMAWLLFLLVLKAPNHAIRYFNLERKEGLSFMAAIKKIYLSAHILPYKLDWIHYEFATLAIGKELLAKAMKAKMGVSLRGFDIGIYPLKNPGCYSMLWKTVDKVHTISDDLEYLANSHGMSTDTKVVKITPAINTSKFRLKNEPGNFDDPIRFLTIGRLNWKKGYEVAIEAMSILQKAGVDFRYSIVGTGLELERLKFAVHQLNLTERVKFLGRIEHKAVCSVYLEHDIYVQPSLQEGFCNSVLEAQMSGLLCIVSDAEGLSENVLNGKTGWVVPRRDPSALAKTIIEVLNLPEDQRKFIARSASERIQTKFSLEEQIQKFYQFYQNE